MFTVLGLTLREFRTTDADDLTKLFNDVRMASMITGGFVIPLGPRFRENIVNAFQSPQVEMACIIEDGRKGGKPVFVGMTSLTSLLDRGHRSCDFSIALVPEYWGNGYGTAITKFMIGHAFEELNMQRVSLDVWEENERAREVYERVGFRYEGMKREVRWSKGARRGLVTMGILKKEWEADQARA